MANVIIEKFSIVVVFIINTTAQDSSDVSPPKAWRTDYQCGGDFLAPNGEVAQCDPEGPNPCCSPFNWCDVTPSHCDCEGCIDYRVIDVSSPKAWRDDYRCGGDFLTPNGEVAQCDPVGPYPCCSPVNWCGITVDHCDCEGCIDYRVAHVSPPKAWRTDLQCGGDFLAPNGEVAQCDPEGPNPCCSPYNWCDVTPSHCDCEGCIDYRVIDVSSPKAWRDDYRCGGNFLAPNGEVAQCDPEGPNPCCSPNNWCDVTPSHCDCYGCIDYRAAHVSPPKAWRTDYQCGGDFLAPNGEVAQCDPEGPNPCCSPYNWCDVTSSHCDCEGCIDYRVIDVSSPKAWRDDYRCGGDFLAPNGEVAQCDPEGTNPCCSPSNWCDVTSSHCHCYGCIDYRVAHSPYTFIEDIRLVDGPAPNMGHVEVQVNGVWGTVCDDGWDFYDATVTCKQLGFPGADNIRTESYFGRSAAVIWLDNVECVGTESTLNECPKNDIGDHNCDAGEHAGVICLSSTTPAANLIIEDIRLVDGPTSNMGRVEVLVNGVWGAVCDDEWDMNDASVTCKQLKFPGAEAAMKDSYFGSGSDVIWLDNVDCVGNETTLDECPKNDIGDEDCGESEHAGVECRLWNTPLDIHLHRNTTLRLSRDSAGRVEIFKDGQWGSICDESWDMPDADVVCRQLGFNGSLRVLHAGTFLEGSGPIHLSQVQCYGNETNLLDCRHETGNICDHSNDAGVECVPLGDSLSIAEGSAPMSPWTLVSFSLLFLMVITASILVWRRKRKKSKQHSVPMSSVLTYSKSDSTRDVDPLLKSKEIHPSNIELHNELGRGKFGVVYKATVKNIDGTSEVVEAAVKTSNVKATVEEREALIEEMKLMVELGDHPNILPLLASCSVREPYYLITVCMKYGDLLHFLRKCRNQENIEKDSTFRVGEKEKLIISLQIAKGMAYVREQRFYHGDLAARNILVGDGLDIKISDFGLAEDLYTKGYQRRTQEIMIPIKWCSLETILNGICSSDADIWSYGVVLYEIYTLGGTPYPGIEGRFLVTQLKKGYRMEQPDQCPDNVYEIMQRCWLEDPNERMKFQEIVEKMDDVLDQMTEYFQFISEDKVTMMTDSEETNVSVPVTGHDVIPTEDRHQDNFAPIIEEDDKINIDDLQAVIRVEGSSTTEDVRIHICGAQNDYVKS